jgi:hypothetical protein
VSHFSSFKRHINYSNEVSRDPRAAIRCWEHANNPPHPPSLAASCLCPLHPPPRLGEDLLPVPVPVGPIPMPPPPPQALAWSNWPPPPRLMHY